MTESEVARIVSSLSNSPSVDIYGLNSKVVKATLHVILPYLTNLINNMFEQAEWPEILKVSRVLPIFKKGDESDLGSYRPIAIIPIFAKIAEIALNNRLIDFFNSFKIFSANQFGFRRGRSTISAVIEIVGGIVEGVDEGLHSEAILCDLTKAFDCVSHVILCQKLEFYGVRGKPLRLLQSYLEGRQQCVKLGNKVSALTHISHGIPQGSVLGPTLFNIYINDLPNYMSPICGSKLYADDTTLLFNSSNIEHLDIMAEEALRWAEYWFHSNKLKLNQLKTQTIKFTTRRTCQNQQPVNLLGIVLDAHLQWDCHVDYLCKKLSSSLFLLRSLKRCLSIDMVLRSYYAFFHSKLSYGIMLWGNHTAAKRVLIMQKKAIRVIYNLKYREHCKPYFRLSGVMTVPAVYLFYSLVHIHDTRDCYRTHADVHSHYTRHRHNIMTSRHRLSLTQRNSLQLALYNILPSSWKASTLRIFKSKLKNYLTDNPIYDVRDFPPTALPQ